jgi:gliding motility-associated-like protein
MKYRYLFLFLIVSLAYERKVAAQIVGGSVFMQGRWLEVGVCPNGAWGNNAPAPAGFHDATSAVTAGYPGTPPGTRGVDFLYDAGHDGWATAGAGSEIHYGCYFLPGTPFDGWQVEIDDTMASAFYSSGRLDTVQGGNFTGGVAGFYGPSCWNPRSANTGIWEGRYGLRRPWLRQALRIVQVNEVDTNASWCIVTTKFYNTSDSMMRGVYYMATGDPDNDQPWPGGSFPTHNHISYQGGPFDRHEVNARPPSIHQDAFSGLATQDCRAKALIYQSWPPSIASTAGNNLNRVWAETASGMGGTYYALGHTTFSQDIAYGLVFNVGNIAPHDSASICFGWIFSDTTAVDSLYTQIPQFSTIGSVISPGQIDSVIGCDLTGCRVLGPELFEANVINGEHRKWALSKWTWSPAIGLSSTVGTRVNVDVSALSGPVIYTITGTPDPLHGSCNQPGPVTFYLYVRPCFDATNNGPVCFSDTLKLFANGDSTGATYQWFGPGGYTASTQYARRNPLLTWADTGLYTVVRYVGTATDTAYTRVMLKPLPTVTATSNAPICSGPPNILNLFATAFDPAVTYSWSGPVAFTSTLQNPSRPDPPVAFSGIYKVVTELNGCFDSGIINVIVDTTPAVPTVGSNSPVCSGHRDTLKLTASCVTPFVSYSWAGPLGFTSFAQDPMIGSPHVPATGTYTVTVSRTADGITCRNSNTIYAQVDSTPYPPTLGSNGPICSSNTLMLTATSSAGSTYRWDGPNSFTSALQNPSITGAITAATGTYSVSATAIYVYTVSGIADTLTCISDTTSLYVVVDSTPEVPTASSNSPGPPSICQGDTLLLFANDATAGVTYSWEGPASFTSTQQNPVVYNVNPAATGQYTVTAILGSCTASTIITVSITPTPTLIVTKNNPVCTGLTDTLFLQASSNPGATFHWEGPFVFVSDLQSPFRTPVIMEMAGVYEVTSFLNGCTSKPVFDTVIIRKRPDAPMIKDLTFCQGLDAPFLDAYGDSIVWYPNGNAASVGTINPPKPPTASDTVMWYYVTQTIMSCTSALDSFKVIVRPSPNLTLPESIEICPHESVAMTASSTSDPLTYYHWRPNFYISDTFSASVIVTPASNMTYTVVAGNQYGCNDTNTVKITVKPGAVLFTGDSVTLYPGESIQLNTQGNCSDFTWFPPAGLDNYRSSNPVASPQISTKYKVYGTTSWGCEAVDSVSIYINPESVLILPNAFTPGNEPNATFKVLKRGMAELKYFRIWDRWGVKVFETADINEGWDGTYKGKAQPFGVYIYEVGAVTTAGRSFSKQGNVTLLR